MERDFTLKKYEKLCRAIVNSGYATLTVEQYLTSQNLPLHFIILRHDVDRMPKNALEIAKLEKNIGVRSTYYFRAKKGVFKPDILKEIASMGFEIGYHYEVLDKAKGNFEKAIKIFETELEVLRKIATIRTISPHGNPSTPWLNSDLWHSYSFERFGLKGDAFLSLDFNTITYFSDTGRNWDRTKYKIKDRVNIVKNSGVDITYTDGIISLIKNKELDRICIVTHPSRWMDNLSLWALEIASQKIKNIGKVCIKPH